MLPSGETVSSLLGLLYEASASPERWPGFLGALQEFAHAEAVAFVLVDPESRCSFVVNPGFDPNCQRTYSEYFSRHDVLFKRSVAASRLHGGWIGTNRSVISDAEYHRSQVFNDFTKPMGLVHQVAATLEGLDGGLEGGLTMHRKAQSGPFGAETVALLSMLAPHLKRALNTHRVLSLARGRNAVLRQTVESMGQGVLSLDSRGRVLRMTAAAQAILDARDGIEVERGFLRSVVEGEQERLTELVAGATATGTGRGTEFAIPCLTRTAPEAGRGPLWTPSAGGAMLISRQPPKRPLQLVVAPFHSSEVLLEDCPAAVVFLSDPDARPASRASILRSLYGLTPTECRLADLLMEGCDLGVASARLKMATGTARFHLKAIFRKTGTGRQSELMRLVLGLPGV